MSARSSFQTLYSVEAMLPGTGCSSMVGRRPRPPWSSSCGLMLRGQISASHRTFPGLCPLGWRWGGSPRHPLGRAALPRPSGALQSSKYLFRKQSHSFLELPLQGLFLNHPGGLLGKEPPPPRSQELDGKSFSLGTLAFPKSQAFALHILLTFLFMLTGGWGSGWNGQLFLGSVSEPSDGSGLSPFPGGLLPFKCHIISASCSQLHREPGGQFQGLEDKSVLTAPLSSNNHVAIGRADSLVSFYPELAPRLGFRCKVQRHTQECLPDPHGQAVSPTCYPCFLRLVFLTLITTVSN